MKDLLKNKKVLLGLGALVLAGVGYYVWKHKKPAKAQPVRILAGQAVTETEDSLSENPVLGKKGASTTTPPMVQPLT